MSLHGLSMPLAIGANCVFRRKALDSIGGHAESLAEDANTSLRLHAKGWQSAYVPYRASYGLVPEDLTTFFKQQLKWSTGMFKLFFGEYFKSIKKLSWAGKIYYFFAGTFYLNGPVALLTFALPVIFLFCKIFAVEMSFIDFLVHLIPYLLVSVIINFFTQKWFSDSSERGFPWRSIFLEKGSWYIYLLGFIYAVSGKKVLYLPTPKNAARDACVKLVLPNIIVVILSLAAVIFVFCTYQRIDGGTILMSAFAIVNVLSLLPVIYTGIKPLVIKIPEVEMEFPRTKEAVLFTGQTELQADPSRTELAAERNSI
jgi:cellulose synthase (UDP-forming)